MSMSQTEINVGLWAWVGVLRAHPKVARPDAASVYDGVIAELRTLVFAAWLLADLTAPAAPRHADDSHSAFAKRHELAGHTPSHLAANAAPMLATAMQSSHTIR